MPACNIAASGSEQTTTLSAANVAAARRRRSCDRSASASNATLSTSRYGLSSMATTVATIATPFGGGTTIQMQRADKMIASGSNSITAMLSFAAADKSSEDHGRTNRTLDQNAATCLGFI